MPLTSTLLHRKGIDMFRTSLVLALMMALLHPFGALAQDEAQAEAPRVANGTAFGKWSVTCEALAVNETTCVLTQRLVRTADNAFLAEFLAFWSADGATRYVAARVPTGVYLPAGFVLRPETDPEGDELAFVWQSCGRDLCEALIVLDDDMATRLEAAENLLAGYRPNLLSEPAVFNLSFAGLDAGLAALRPAE
jgi:invasion protein IalB